MKYSTLIFALFLFSSCIQNYSNEYKNEAQRVCQCMKDRKQIRNQNIAEELEFILDDEDYPICLIDSKINMIDTESDEFTNAIKGECPELLATQERYLRGF